MQLDLAHKLIVGVNRLLGARNDILADRAKRHHSLEVLLRLVKAATRQAVEHVGEQRSFFERRVGHTRVGALRLVGIERFGLEPDRLLVEPEREEMRAQLFGSVVIEQLVGRGRLHGARRRRFLVAEQQVMVCDERRLAQRGRFFAPEEIAGLERLPHCRLGNTVEVEVVLPNELEHLGIV